MAGLGRQDLVRLMIGRSEQIPDWSRARTATAPSRSWSCAASPPRLGHAGIDLTVRRGEIVGLYGLVGAGRTRARQVRSWACVPLTAGEIRVEGKAARIGSVAEAIHRHGIGYVSEDRKQEGLILMHTRAGAMPASRSGDRLASRLGFLRDGAVAPAVEPVHAPSSRCARRRWPRPSATCPAATSRRSASPNGWRPACRVLIVDEPTVGIDIKTKAYLHELLRAPGRRRAPRSC